MNGRATSKYASRAQAVGVLVRYYCGSGRGGGPNLSPVLIGEAGTVLECFLSSRECGRYGKHSGSPSRPALVPVPATSAALRLPGRADKRGPYTLEPLPPCKSRCDARKISPWAQTVLAGKEPHRRRDPRPLRTDFCVRSKRCMLAAIHLSVVCRGSSYVRPCAVQLGFHEGGKNLDN